MKWKRISAGEYQSSDNRFYILNTYDRIYGNHWTMYDRQESDYYKGKYHEHSLQECKEKAESIMRR